VSDVPTFYVNAVTAHGGPFDLTLDFGYRPGGETYDTQVRLAMSWEHTKLLSEMLGQAVKQYEEKVNSEVPSVPLVMEPEVEE